MIGLFRGYNFKLFNFILTDATNQPKIKSFLLDQFLFLRIVQNLCLGIDTSKTGSANIL